MGKWCRLDRGNRGAVAIVVAAMLLCSLPAVAAERLAVFDFELIDTSLEGEVSGPREDEQRRLKKISQELRQSLAASGRYDIVDTTVAAKHIDDAGYLHSCNGCDIAIARDLGAALAMTGTVQKVSNLILNINLYLRDVESGKLIKMASADIRGNTDKSWSRGVSYLVRNRILKGN